MADPDPDAITWTYAFTGTLDANGTTMKGIAKEQLGLALDGSAWL